MADAIALERRGIPSVVVAIDRLVRTTGKAMARAHGAPDFPFAIIDWPFASLDMLTEDQQIESIAQGVVGQVERILLEKITGVQS